MGGDEMKTPLSVCFVSLYAYPLLNQAARYVFGGSEVRAWLFGQALARLNGGDVSFVVYDHGQKGVEVFDGLKVFPHSYYKGSAIGRTGLKRLIGRGRERVEHSFFLKKSLRLKKERVYWQVGARVYCSVGLTRISAEVAQFCAAAGRRFVFLFGHDVEFSPDWPETRGYLGAILKAADLVITQTEEQSDWLKERFGATSLTIKNPIDLSGASEPSGRPPAERFALWVGKSKPFKRPEKLLELARLVPEFDFVMLLNKGDEDIHGRILAQRPKNVEIVESLPLAETDELFGRAFLLVSTASLEGFPNTFLQAGKHGRPILSLSVDPDGMISRHGCGFLAGGDLKSLAAHLRSLAADDRRWAECGLAAWRYVSGHHRLEDKATQFRQGLESIIEEPEAAVARRRGQDGPH